MNVRLLHIAYKNLISKGYTETTAKEYLFNKHSKNEIIRDYMAAEYAILDTPIAEVIEAPKTKYEMVKELYTQATDKNINILTESISKELAISPSTVKNYIYKIKRES